ncbi:DUF1917-domain-containing protein [Annulohypoxylon maeteangense]|uniref:DUF1917-domain-containing protein n=1 Tax=Annulohypoxylon maeteangense TaxID=1927788 RepID=UPI00200848ED|nr:DUF1917-domain-containing protein [Annulohypoxylon maeteangense]KAI0880948.1 DUF1917-domain-containing protein [Annulohypoxylon maeteangense]
MSSDDSDFYGDDDIMADLKAKVRDFDPETWWGEHGDVNTPLRIQAQSEDVEMKDVSNLHNPYAGLEYAWQLTETIEAFLERVPPATTDATPKNPWIWVCNPYISRKKKSESLNQHIRGCEDEAPEEEGADLPRVVEGGMARLHFVSEYINMCKNSGNGPAFIARECRTAGVDAAKDILNLAKAHHVRCGKWMLFCNTFEVNEIWKIIAKATINNELGIGAKVAPRQTTDKRTERLICVYTADFSDTQDVKRVAEKLKKLGLVQAHDRPLYYKPDVYTYLGIAHGNPWEIRASIYDTKTMLKTGKWT